MDPNHPSRIVQDPLQRAIATHLGPLGGIPPSGKPVAMKEMAFWHVAAGRLRAVWSVGDALGLRVQMGALPPASWQQPVRETEDPT
jgi:hypothetical protein